MKTWFRHKHNCCVDSYKKMKWQHSNIPSFATGEVSLSRLAAISYLYFYFIFFKIEHTHTHAHIDKGTVTHTLLHTKKETRTRMRVHIYWTQSHDDIEINVYLRHSFFNVFCTGLFGSASIIGTVAYKSVGDEIKEHRLSDVNPK